MHEHQTFAEDVAELALEQYADKTIDRRTLVKALGMLGLAPVFFKSGAAFGQVKELVVVNWGGPAIKAYQNAFGKPFEKKTGIKIVIDGTGPGAGKVRAMVDAKNVTWDVLDAGVGTALLLGSKGYLEAIDYNIVDKSKVRPEFVYKWGISDYLFSFVLTYDGKKLGDRKPTSWKDFWNVKDFPGKRLLRKNPIGQLECALLGDGVPHDKVYPIDLDRALEKIREIKEHTVFWGSGSQSQQFFMQGEVVMGNLWHNRSNLLRRDTKDRIQWTWTDGIVASGVWSVVKNNPGGKDAAMKFIDFAIGDVDGQIALFKVMSSGPANPKATAMVPADMRAYDPSQPENYNKQVKFDAEWWGKNEIEAFERYRDVISS
ncbi:MAG: ABC transporter substrate-binding protein [Rhodospirillaceae bacterium]|nr:ABC transporter substrate-binding protein [Rhodospirillaceae bacterium]MDE0704326.1 ABC transporter substrate-binding protein [Rhodospirillaceae bacterium]